jgi:hypothetical protein
VSSEGTSKWVRAGAWDDALKEPSGGAQLQCNATRIPASVRAERRTVRATEQAQIGTQSGVTSNSAILSDHYVPIMTDRTPIILSSGEDAGLLRTRSLVLQKAGFEVILRLPEEALLTLRKRDDIQGVVLCHSIDVDERVELAQQMREVSPKLAIVMMHKVTDTFDASDCDSVVESLVQPEILVAAVRRALKKQQSP